MVETILEYRKGILFVRISGILSKDTISEVNSKIISIIEADQMQNIVFNIENLSKIDFKGINFIFYIYELCRKNKGKFLICGMDNEMKDKLRKNRVFHYVKEISNELAAFDLIEI